MRAAGSATLKSGIGSGRNSGEMGLVQALALRATTKTGGLLLIALGLAVVAALATWNVADPSFSSANDNAVTNALGFPGAAFSDLAMQFFGLGSVFLAVPLLSWGANFAAGRLPDRVGRRVLSAIAGTMVISAIFGCAPVTATWPLPSGLGGVLGDIVLKLPSMVIGAYPSGVSGIIVGLLLTAPAIWLAGFGSGLIRPWAPMAHAVERTPANEPADDFEDDQGSSGGLSAMLGGVTHAWLSLRAAMHRAKARRGHGTVVRPTGRARQTPVEPGFEALDTAAVARPRRAVEPATFDEAEEIDAPLDEMMDDLDDGYDVEADWAPQAKPQPSVATPIAAPAPVARVTVPVTAPKAGTRVIKEAQKPLIADGSFELPSLHFLSEPKTTARDPSLSKDALEQNARLLEGVLEDFGVRGEIIHVRPGPVVTMYELEPAPGIKSSRVIGLADDIARSMSAIAARVAVVPGRNAIGIELPNAVRETVYLRELLASRDYEASKAKLGLALGKTINGEAVIADLAKMPHVLVAGTTGSGKSVAINTMILSLLYRMTPEQCRLIMIDPKMLELSVYDGIPHLLTPVVTDPKKAVVALKWTVREMEDRYRKMSKVGVRNIDGFNQRVSQAAKKGERITRTVQTGFDRDTGEAVYETEEFDLDPMPYIVVLIDEMADLMMVAGKDIEGTVQRLAQMARAAGIHVIMATQRPSVDVITGTIKANFPTRISFQVTSKIDSRTILGEQGAEQLLGMGDMLYMAGGGRIQRVHGPFVSDTEVEQVVSHLKLQGIPEYLDSITEEDDEEGDSGDGGGSAGGNFDESDDPYDQAVSVVLRDKKVSTSYIQRRLGIGYNRAASLIERMEEEGLISAANHAGKREILVPTEDDTL
jgi:S-DNA-T family DNA segregation ATPase FtsK/SpoIIIE